MMESSPPKMLICAEVKQRPTGRRQCLDIKDTTKMKLSWERAM